MTGPTARTATPAEPDGPEPASRALASLLGEAAAARLLTESFGRGPFRARIGHERAAGLFGWPQLNDALAQQRLIPPRLRLERAGADATKGLFKSRRTRRGELMQDLDPAVLMERLREGATLIVDAVNEISPPLQAVCAGLSADFACSSQANLYACWGTTQGFDIHWDDHDVLVVQVEGRKLWRLYGSNRPAPVRREGCADHRAPEQPLEEIVLEPGDVLYLPRGYWHAAVGLGGPTLHLTVGLTRKIGSDLLHWLADQLLSEEVVRQDLPLERSDAELGAHVAQVLAALTRQDPKALGRAYRRRVENAQAQRPQLSFPFLGDDLAFAPQTRLALAQGATRLSPPDEGEVVLSWRGVEFTVSAALAPALEALIGEGELSFAVFEALAPAHVRPRLPDFLAELVRRGALVVRAGSAA